MPVLATALQEFGAFKRSAEPDVGVATLTQDRATPTTHATQATTPAAPQAARHVAHQIAVAVTQGSGGTTEIALRPQELGNVRLALTASETAVNVVILTERPETQDLLRRHIDTLAQEFKALGYDNISFSFGGRDQSQTSQNAAVAAEGADMTTPDLPHDASPQMTHKSGLDLRL